MNTSLVREGQHCTLTLAYVHGHTGKLTPRHEDKHTWQRSGALKGQADQLVEARSKEAWVIHHNRDRVAGVVEGTKLAANTVPPLAGPSRVCIARFSKVAGLDPSLAAASWRICRARESICRARENGDEKSRTIKERRTRTNQRFLSHVVGRMKQKREACNVLFYKNG